MRRLKVAFRNTAIDDLEEVYRYVRRASGSRETGLAFVGRIKRRCGRIGDVPHGGRPRDDLEPGLRTVPFEHSAIIAYKVEADRVRIVNIFYGGRDFEAFYLDTPTDDAEE